MIRRACGLMIAACLAAYGVLFVLFALVALPAGAAGNADITGTFAVTDTGGSFPQTWDVTSENLQTGDFVGTDTGSGEVFTLSGVVTGNSFTAQTQGGTYTSNGTGTITGSPGSYSVSGSFSDSNGNHLTFSGTETVPGVPRSGSTSTTEPPNGGLDIDRYCVLIGDTASVLERGSVDGPGYAFLNWGCRTPTGGEVLIATSGTAVPSMNNACKVEYPAGSPRYAYNSNANDAYTWVCRREGAGGPGTSGTSQAAGNQARSTIASSLATPKEAFGSAKHTILNAVITAGVVLFIAFPSQLFNHTFQENYADIEAWWRRRSSLDRLRRWLGGSKVATGDLDGAVPAVATAAAVGGTRAASASTTSSVGTDDDLATEVAEGVAVASLASNAAVSVGIDEDLMTEVAEGVAEAPAITAGTPVPSAKEATPAKRFPTAAWVVIALGAIFGVMLDPAAGLNGQSITTFIAVVASTLLGMVLSGFVAHRYRKIRKRGTEFFVTAIPAGLLMAVVCVVVSRVSDFQPGYLYGIICGVSFSGTLQKNEQGHTVALSTITTLGVALLAWLAWVPVNQSAAHPGALWPVVLADDFLAAVFTGGIVGATIGSFPLRFLPGGTVAAWHKGAWALIAGCVTFVFVEVILDPKEGGHAGHASLVTVIILLVVFGGGSILFYDHFNRKKKKAEAAEKAAAPA